MVALLLLPLPCQPGPLGVLCGALFGQLALPLGPLALTALDLRDPFAVLFLDEGRAPFR